MRASSLWRSPPRPGRVAPGRCSTASDTWRGTSSSRTSRPSTVTAHRALDDVPQLADVARPVVRLEQAARLAATASIRWRPRAAPRV